MIVVSDTGPLNYLTLIEVVEVLPALFERVIMPPAVIAELTRSRAPDVVKSLVQNPPNWLQFAKTPPVDLTLIALDAGEREAIVIAQTLPADALLCDDAEARAVAVTRKVNVIGTLGILKLASNRGLLQLDVVLDRLAKTNFRASKSVIARILKREKGID